MLDSGGRNFLNAKRKAAQRLGIRDERQLPANREIEQALAEYQRLFRGHTQPEQLLVLRRAALEAMRFVTRFRPRLVGPVLEGTADRHSEVHLHLFAEPVEDVGHFLTARGIPFELVDRRLRLASGAHERVPEFRFLAGEATVAMTVFSGPGAHAAPLSPVDGRPMRRAGAGEVEALIQASPEPGSGMP